MVDGVEVSHDYWTCIPRCQGPGEYFCTARIGFICSVGIQFDILTSTLDID
jgi:hypothetical protein